MAFTWRQFASYLHQARRRQAQRRLDAITDMRAALLGGDSGASLIRALAAQSKG